MKLPKVVFEYSYIYDYILHGYHRKKYQKNQYKAGERYASHLQTIWNRQGARILRTMSSLSGLKWKSNIIRVYPVKHVIYEFSHPLTIFFYKDDRQALSILIHELSHMLVWENRAKVRWSLIKRCFPKNSYITNQHLLIHAICKLTTEKIFGEKSEYYLKYERWWEWHKSELTEHYKKSWKIVQKETPQKLLRKFVKMA